MAEPKKMWFRKQLLKEQEKIESAYDLIAFCYEIIIREIDDWEMFYGYYLDKNEKSEKVNPNLNNLNKYYKYLYMEILNASRDGKSIDMMLEMIGDTTDETIEGLTGFGDEGCNTLTVIYYLILVLDSFCGMNLLRESKRGYLNQKYSGGIYVYTVFRNDFLEEARDTFRYADKIREISINDYLQNIIIISKEICKKDTNPTQIAWITMEDRVLQEEICDNKKLRLAVIPFNGFGITTFHYPTGSLLEVTYDELYHHIYGERAINLLKFAISEKANIVVFPEFVCSPKIQRQIAHFLQSASDEHMQGIERLLFVVAGSGWQDHNNVARVYNRYGEEIGCYFKRTRYVDKKGNFEALRNPGKESLVICVDGVGSFMPAICRDISDGTKLSPLIEAFEPFMILVPAWSSSIRRGFEQQFENISNNIYSSLVLCNSCEPLIGKRGHNICNLVTTPYKEVDDSLAKAQTDCLEKEPKCVKKCDKEGCIFLLEMDYSLEAMKNRKIVSSKDKKMLNLKKK